MAKEDAQAAATGDVTDDPRAGDPDAPTSAELAQDGAHDPVAHAERLAQDAGDRIQQAALVAHDLGADAARDLRSVLLDALKRVERAVYHHDQEA